MKKSRSVYVCEACGGRTLQWAGQCPDCGAWNTLSESRAPATPDPAAVQPEAGELILQDLSRAGDEVTMRYPTGLAELDRVLGGGLVPGSVTLIGGDPGIGKSTLLLQAAASLAGRHAVLYVSGEESLAQVGLRARRLEVSSSPMLLAAETSVERILDAAQKSRPGVMIVDSIQTMYTGLLQSAPGSVAQLRESSALLMRHAKRTGTAVFLVGHVTKEGLIAGPRVLEHMVDTVLYFENDAGSRYRVIRAVKNRFGAANELGVFAMTEIGLREVKNPSAIFLSRHGEAVSGSAVTVIREGTRPMLIEVQALVDDSPLGNPRRVAVGMDPNRLSMLLAVMHRHGGIALSDQDVFVNVVGGLRVSETGADLAVLLAALSSFRNRPLPQELIVFGEVGLAGEIRPVYNGEERLREAAKQGFRRAIVPRDNAPRKAAFEGLEVVPVTRLAEAVAAL